MIHVPPILLLRSFDDDEALAGNEKDANWLWVAEADPATYEEQLVIALAGGGPVIAVGRPGKIAPPVGAARLWVSRESWQERVSELIERSRYIVMVMGDVERHPGLTWELNRVLDAAGPEKLILVVPPLGEEELERRWEQYRWQLTGRIPPFQGNELAVTFSRDWTCRVEFVKGERSPRSYGVVLFPTAGCYGLPSFPGS